MGALNSQHGLFKSIFSILCLKFEISRAFVAEMEQMYIVVVLAVSESEGVNAWAGLGWSW